MDHWIEHNRENENKWDRRAGSYDKKRFDYFRWMQKKTVKKMTVSEGMTFLDLGCGTGWAVRYVSGLTHGNGEFWGIDISDAMIAKANVNSQGFKNVRFLKANAEAIPFEEEYFDSITCTNSFHHYLHPDIVLAEVFRLLKAGGKIFILDVTADDCFIANINRRVQRKEKAHVSFYSTPAYKEMFSGSGLRYLRSIRITYPLKLHIAEKAGSQNRI